MCIYAGDQVWKTKNGLTVIRLLGGRSNVFLLTDGTRYILVDTSIRLLWKKLQRKLEKRNIRHIDYLILTHSHFDHAANAGKIREKYGAKVVIHETEADNLENGTFIIPDGTFPITRFLINALRKLMRPSLRITPCRPDLKAGPDFSLKETGFNVSLLHTPGHTTGSVSVIVDDEIALAGDAMVGTFRWTVFPPFAQDVPLLLRTWEKLLVTGCSLFLPSHGPAVTREMLEKDFQKRKRTL